MMGEQSNRHVEVGGKGVMVAFISLTLRLQLTLHTIMQLFCCVTATATKSEPILFKHS